MAPEPRLEISLCQISLSFVSRARYPVPHRACTVYISLPRIQLLSWRICTDGRSGGEILASKMIFLHFRVMTEWSFLILILFFARMSRFALQLLVLFVDFYTKASFLLFFACLLMFPCLNVYCWISLCSLATFFLFFAGCIRSSLHLNNVSQDSSTKLKPPYISPPRQPCP